MAMSAYYLKGIAPPSVQLSHIFKGVMPYLGMVFICMFLMYEFPALVFSLPDAIYGAR